MSDELLHRYYGNMIIQMSKVNRRKSIDWWLQITLLVWIFTLVLFILKTDVKFLIIGITIPILLGTPMFYLYIEYLHFSKFKKITIDFPTKTFSVFDKKEESQYSFSGIKEIQIYGTRSLFKTGRIRYLFSESFHFAIINLKNDSNVIVTCFMVYPVSIFVQQFENVNLSYRQIIFPSIFLRKLSWKYNIE